MSTHSPVVLRELSSAQLYVVKKDADKHTLNYAGQHDAIQGPLRSFPEAFLGSHVLVCEGATEVGYIRGLDLFRRDRVNTTFAAKGGVTVDAGGVSKLYAPALAFQALGYRTAVLRDDDVKPNSSDETQFQEKGGRVFKWSDDYAIENEIFECLADDFVGQLLKVAESLHGRDRVLEHIRTVNQGPVEWDEILLDVSEFKGHIGEAAKKGDWFKRIDWMEEASRKIIGPGMRTAHEDLKSVTKTIFKWAIKPDD